MKQVAKYNLFKGVSTLLTVGTPIATLAACNVDFIKTPAASISAVGIFAILISLLLFKDKITAKTKNKVPSAFLVASIVFGVIVLVENVLAPMKIVCLATMITSGVDKLTFEQFYKRIDALLPETKEAYKYAGFLITTTDKLLGVETNKNNEVTNNEQSVEKQPV